MRIGIDGSRAFIKNRTGIEEYSYQVIKNLRYKLKSHQVVLYVRKNQEIDFEIPKNWKVRVIKFSRFWTQIGLSLEMLFHPVDVLFVPAHTVPIIHPENTVVVVHGLEYEFCPKSYSLWDRVYMRCSIKNSCAWAKKIISVSENTKKDLVNLYGVDEKKVSVIYEGYSLCHPKRVSQQADESRNLSARSLGFAQDDNFKYLLFVGRVEERKNIGNIISAFELLKGKYDIPHKLVLAGKHGYGYEHIKAQITNSKFQNEIKELGFVSEEEKWELLEKADVFLFPTLYEGFGIPILEAQSVGCPVVASNNSSIPEVASGSALLIDAQSPEDIAENTYKLISKETLKSDIIAKGLENVKKFSWDKCSNQIAKLLNC